MAIANEPDVRPELVFALVGAAGARLDDLAVALKAELGTFGYRTEDVRLSELLVNFDGWTAPDGPGEYARIANLQKMGNALRSRLQDGAALARAGVSEIRAKRAAITGDPDSPASGVAYVIRQLKHPLEVDLLRQIYGSSFMLIAGHAPRAARVEDLAKRMAQAETQRDAHQFEGKASDVITADEAQNDDFGQNTRDTYPKADFFANLGVPLGQESVRRFVDLMFGQPFHTPTPDEYAMYQASAVGLRSSDDNRQVGAAIVSLTRDPSQKIKNADVIAVGMNEVPRGGGGFYWDQTSPDHRDQALLAQGRNPAEDAKISTLAELIERIGGEKWLAESAAARSSSELARSLLPKLKRTQFADIGEFSRPVHAEMAALIDAARRGVAVDGQSMYVTTFPCHNCAKHIIATGLKRIVYLEPYPKSRARDLYGEEITWESSDGKEEADKVVFWAYSGVAPRQYRQLFSITERGAKKGRSLQRWQSDRLVLRPLYVRRHAALEYVAEEREALKMLTEDVYKRGS